MPFRRYWGIWRDTGRAGMIGDYFPEHRGERVPRNFPTDEQILLVVYEYENYSGSAYVLYVENGVLYEEQSGHCSCNGLEGMWDPDRTTVEAMAMRPRAVDEWSGWMHAYNPAVREQYWAIVEVLQNRLARAQR